MALVRSFRGRSVQVVVGVSGSGMDAARERVKAAQSSLIYNARLKFYVLQGTTFTSCDEQYMEHLA